MANNVMIYVHFDLQPPQIYQDNCECALETSLKSLFYYIEIFWEATCLICNDRSYEAVILFFF